MCLQSGTQLLCRPKAFTHVQDGQKEQITERKRAGEQSGNHWLRSGKAQEKKA